jgi:hypothetical protein
VFVLQTFRAGVSENFEQVFSNIGRLCVCARRYASSTTSHVTLTVLRTAVPKSYCSPACLFSTVDSLRSGLDIKSIYLLIYEKLTTC